MAKEKFRQYAVDETEHWNKTTLAKYGIVAAFGIYLIRDGERTHIASTQASTWGVALENAFVFLPGIRDETREEANDELGNESLESDYFGYVDVKTCDQRFIGKATIIEVDAREHKGGLRGDSYHRAIWDAAEEEACNGYDQPRITWEETYFAYQVEKAEKVAREEADRATAAQALTDFLASKGLTAADLVDMDASKRYALHTEFHSVPPVMAKGKSPLQEARAQLRELRREMKANGIKKTSPFNGGMTRETQRYNERRFALEVQIERLLPPRDCPSDNQ